MRTLFLYRWPYMHCTHCGGRTVLELGSQDIGRATCLERRGHANFDDRCALRTAIRRKYYGIIDNDESSEARRLDTEQR